MNSTQFGSMIRIIMGALAGISGTLGVLKDVDWVAVTSVLVALGTSGWSYFAHTTPKLIATIAESPDVHKVVVTPALAMVVPSLKVVAK